MGRHRASSEDTTAAAALGASSLAGREIAFLIAPEGAEGAEQAEMLRPCKAVAKTGGRAMLVSTKEGRAQLFEHLDRGGQLRVDRTVAVAAPADYDALVLPGGVANPDMPAQSPRADGSHR
jgi:protease I